MDPRIALYLSERGGCLWGKGRALTLSSEHQIAACKIKDFLAVEGIMLSRGSNGGDIKKKTSSFVMWLMRAVRKEYEPPTDDLSALGSRHDWEKNSPRIAYNSDYIT